MIKLGFSCKCPKCKKGPLFKEGLTLELRDQCPECHLDLSKNDSADGPAVFLIFILGFAIVPLALIADAAFDIPLWLHGVIWTTLILILTIGSLRPIKSYIIALQYKHRPTDWE